MEVGEKDREKVQTQVPWNPTTPSKPIVHRPSVPIYTLGERIQLGSHDYGVHAYYEPSATADINNTRPQHWLGHGAAVTNIASKSATAGVRLALDNFPGSSNGFTELLAQAQAPSTHYYNGIHDGFLQNQSVPTLSSQFNPTYTLLGHHQFSGEQPLFNAIQHKYQEPQGTSYFAYYDKTASHIAPPAPDNAIRSENTRDTGMQLHMGEKDQRREEKEVPNAEQSNNESAHNKELCDPAVEFAAVSTQSIENHNKEVSQHIDLNKTPQQKPRRRKHRPKVIKEDKPARNRKPVTRKPVQSKENATGKRRNVRKGELNSISPQAETSGECTKPMMSESAKKTCRRSLNFDRGEQQRDGNSACIEFGAAVTKTQAENNEETQAPSAPLQKGNSPWAKSNTSSDAGISTRGIQVVGPKRKHSGTIEHEDTSSINLTGVQYNILQAHYPELWAQFPNIQKKRRSEKGRQSSTCNTSSMIATKDVRLVTCPQEDARSSPYASSSNLWTSGSKYNAVRVPVVITATDRAMHNKPQSFEGNLSSGQRQTNRRSRVPTAKTCVDVERQQTGIAALVAEMRATLTKKKRTKKRSTLVSTSYSCTTEMQQNHKFVLENRSLLLDNSLGVACKETWENRYSADALAVQFRQLNINRETRELVLHGQNALVPYNQQNQRHKGLANGCGTIIPYQGIFDPIKKQRPRPKVDLDEETNRVWKLLLLDINSHGIDGMDEDKAKWWEEERNVFRGRADSFIARMHLVQGDRRFTKWKGSVVDSVIGVFLTQNVSDHLSSSAFMSLAARFPLKSSSKYKTYHEESTKLIVNKPQVYIVEPEESTKLDEKLLNPSVYGLSSMTTIDIIEHFEEKEAVDSNDSCRTSGSLTDESNLKMSESTQRHMGEQHSPMESGPISAMTGEGQENSCDGGVGKEVNDMVSSQCSVITSQMHADFPDYQSIEKIQSCSESNSEVEDLSSAAKNNIFYDRTSFSKLLEMASSTTLHEVNSYRSKSTDNIGEVFGQPIGMKHSNQSGNLEKLDITQNLEASITPCDDYPSKMIPNSGVSDINCYDPFRIEGSSRGFSKSKDGNDMKRPRFPTSEPEAQAAVAHSQTMSSQCQQLSNKGQQNALHISGDLMQKSGELDFGDQNNAINENGKIKPAPTKSKSKERQKEKQDDFDWDSLRIQAEAQAGKREKTESTMDSLDWDAVRLADVKEIADVIKERGMNNMLAERIKNFLNLLVDKHGAIDLEWLRDVPPDRAKEYLLSIRGLGLKSVECVRLLTLHNLAFPVDTNVGRIAVRLGWVPLQPLPESLQLHLLELYPVLESIQKYLWPRLCKLDQRTLYELHYQLITFGKVFCTKHKPNCNACPMRGECRHFASAFASARLALPGPEQRNIVVTNGKIAADQNPPVIIKQLPLPPPIARAEQFQQLQQIIEVSKQLEARSETNICQPIIEEPASPEPECSQLLESDIEDAFCEEPGKIPAIKIDMEEFNLNVQNVMEENMELLESEMSKALVALTPEAACIPTPKLKNVNRLRTEHWVYELPDSHRLLEGWDKREPDDPGKYLLAIWTPGETENSTQPPERKCSSQDCGQLCDEKECFSCNSYREANSQIVRGTILIPCRTAMRGSFPLNGTYFQVNEVFADNESSINPIHVPRSWIWNLGRRTVYFGTSIPTIFKGLTTQEIQRCFWRGYVCVRGFDRKTRAPRPLKARLHYPASKLAKKESAPARPQELNLNLQPNPEQPELLSNVPNDEERQGA